MIKYFYHITDYDTAAAILDHGTIDPAFTRGKMAVNWYVQAENIERAAIHLAVNRSMSLGDMCILKVNGSMKIMHYLFDNGFMYCHEPLAPLELIDMWAYINKLCKREARIIGTLTHKIEFGYPIDGKTESVQKPAVNSARFGLQHRQVASKRKSIRQIQLSKFLNPRKR